MIETWRQSNPTGMSASSSCRSAANFFQIHGHSSHSPLPHTSFSFIWRECCHVFKFFLFLPVSLWWVWNGFCSAQSLTLMPRVSLGSQHRKTCVWLHLTCTLTTSGSCFLLCCSMFPFSSCWDSLCDQVDVRLSGVCLLPVFTPSYFCYAPQPKKNPAP